MCGFVGFVGESGTSSFVNLALQAIQHRGQDSAGIAYIKDDGSFFIHKDLGYASHVLKDVNYDGPGVSVGHVRYPTIGEGFRKDAQPFFCRQPGVIMAHNGNIINFEELKCILEDRSINLSSKCDVEPMLYLFSDYLMKIRPKDHTSSDVIEALKKVYKDTKGAYSFVAGLIVDGKKTLICAKGPNGIRPAIWGKIGNGYICASESVCADVIGASEIKDVNPGEVIFFRANEKPKSYIVEKRGEFPCSFEHVYFARPDSINVGKSVYEVRNALGIELGKEFLNKKIDVDFVTPVPDTSIPASLSLANIIGKPFKQVLIKNRYSARTFIMPTSLSRDNALRLKLNPIVPEMKGKKVLLLDDSMVRGATLKKVISMLKLRAKPAEIHLAIHCPPVIYPCFYGIDMSIREDLMAYRVMKDLGMKEKDLLKIENQRKLEEKIAKELKADSITFVSIEGFHKTFGKKACSACFDGNYPIPIDESIVNEIRKDRKRECLCSVKT